MMNDLQICKRVSEIDGYTTFCDGGKYARIELLKHGKVVGYQDYNPLTDDALCFQLMVRYRIKVMYETNPNYYHASRVIHEQSKKPFRVCESDSNPNKAICLAIIEAHKESNND